MRLALLEMPEWSKLLRHFELGQGYALIVLLVGDSSVAHMCRRELDLWLYARERPRVLSLRVESPEDLADVPEELLRIAPPGGPIWVDGSGAREVYEHAWQRCAMKLNRLRDVISGRFSTALLIVGPPWIREILRENAPDFWSTRAFVAEIAAMRSNGAGHDLRPPEAMPASQFRLDPDFMLKEADAIRGRAGLERELAWLLNRAGKEFSRQGRPHEALKALQEAVALNEHAALEVSEQFEALASSVDSFANMAEVLSNLGRGDEALQFSQKALAAAERLVREEPGRADMRQLSLVYINMADLVRRLGGARRD